MVTAFYIDDASVKEVSGGGNWQWIKLRDAALRVDLHTLTFGYRDANVQLAGQGVGNDL